MAVRPSWVRTADGSYQFPRRISPARKKVVMAADGSFQYRREIKRSMAPIDRSQWGTKSVNHRGEIIPCTAATVGSPSVTTPEHRAYIASMVAKVRSQSVTTVDMTSKLLSAADLKEVLSAISNPMTLNDLNLGNNHKLGSQGAFVVGQFLAQSTSLTTLDMRSTRIGDVGLGYILEGLAQNISLTKLDLRRNDFDDESATQIAEFIGSHSFISKLDLRHNRISHQGVQKITQAVKSNGATAEIYLDGANVELQQALDENRNRKMVLSLSWAPPVGGSLRCICSTMGGRELAAVNVNISDNLAALKTKIAVQVSIAPDRVELILSSAQILADDSGVATLQSLLGL